MKVFSDNTSSSFSNSNSEVPILPFFIFEISLLISFRNTHIPVIATSGHARLLIISDINVSLSMFFINAAKQFFIFYRSHTQVLTVIHKCMDAGLLQPGGLTAISQGLSEATPPEHTKYKASTPEGSQQSDAAKNLGIPQKRCEWFFLANGILRRTRKTATPPGSMIHCSLTGGVADAQPPANGLNPFGVLLSCPTAKQGLTSTSCLNVASAIALCSSISCMAFATLLSSPFSNASRISISSESSFLIIPRVGLHSRRITGQTAYRKRMQHESAILILAKVPSIRLGCRNPEPWTVTSRLHNCSIQVS